MVSAVLFITFFVLLVLNVPIAVCLGLSSAAAILYSGTSLTIVATNIYSGISKFLLLAIPFFVLSGNIMAKAGISTRLIRFVDTCVGHRKGGVDSLYSIVQMPSGIPVATVAINGGKNAGILAAKILATSDPELLAKLKAYSEEMKNEVVGKDEKLQKLGHKEYLAQK